MDSVWNTVGGCLEQSLQEQNALVEAGWLPQNEMLGCIYAETVQKLTPLYVSPCSAVQMTELISSNEPNMPNIKKCTLIQNQHQKHAVARTYCGTHWTEVSSAKLPDASGTWGNKRMWNACGWEVFLLMVLCPQVTLIYQKDGVAHASWVTEWEITLSDCFCSCSYYLVINVVCTVTLSTAVPTVSQAGWWISIYLFNEFIAAFQLVASLYLCGGKIKLFKLMNQHVDKLELWRELWQFQSQYVTKNWKPEKKESGVFYLHVIWLLLWKSKVKTLLVIHFKDCWLVGEAFSMLIQKCAYLYLKRWMVKTLLIKISCS